MAATQVMSAELREGLGGFEIPSVPWTVALLGGCHGPLKTLILCVTIPDEEE